MALINQVAMGVLNIVDRRLRARQDQVPATSTISPDTSTATDPITTPSQTANIIGSQPSAGPTSSPLLFFVALGFGVVFTNLWIIVGVKYCFRYNARSRAMRSGNDIDHINLDNIHARPHRRRREKRLMTMEEVNERFPLSKYKSWAASRAREGLSTNGGVSRPPSRAPSVRSLGNPSSSSPVDDSHETQIKSTKTDNIRPTEDTPRSEPSKLEAGHTSEKISLSLNEKETKQTGQSPNVQNLGSLADKKPKVTSEEEEDDEDDQINAVTSPELLSSPGDSCAICIDTLEEEDEVRGLSCGHAFHAGCIDPWLTSRRACCPLCKADYYIPKARLDAEIADAERLNLRRNDRPVLSQNSQSIWSTILSSSRLIISRRSLNTQNPSHNNLSTHPPSVSITSQHATATSVPEVSEVSQPRRFEMSFLSTTIRNIQLPVIQLNRRNRSSDNVPENNQSTSPSQLEAGARR